jgi:hypothetical protein
MEANEEVAVDETLWESGKEQPTAKRRRMNI